MKQKLFEKKIFKLFLITFSFSLLSLSVVSQKTIESVVSSSFNPAPITPEYSSLDAANLIVDAINAVGIIVCSKTMNTTLGNKIDDARNKYKDSLPKGVPIVFLGFIDKVSCQVIAIVPQGQIIRVKNNTCSVNDVNIAYPDLIYTPDQTGMFSIKITF